MTIFTYRPMSTLPSLPFTIQPVATGLYHLPDSAESSDLAYMLQQMGRPGGMPATRGTRPEGMLVIRHQPQLDDAMQDKIAGFDGPVLLLSAASAWRTSLTTALSAYLSDLADLPAPLHWRLETSSQKSYRPTKRPPSRRASRMALNGPSPTPLMACNP